MTKKIYFDECFISLPHKDRKKRILKEYKAERPDLQIPYSGGYFCTEDGSIRIWGFSDDIKRICQTITHEIMHKELYKEYGLKTCLAFDSFKGMFCKE